MMKPFRCISVALLAMAICVPGLAQQRNAQPAMKFDAPEWDFGKINETDGPVTHVFRFTNTGGEPWVVDYVSASCGCTTPSYSREPILPGAAGEITVQYSPRERSGRIEETIIVRSDNGRNQVTLVIKADVVARPLTVEEQYPFLLARGLRFSAIAVNFRYIEQRTVSVLTIDYANTSDRIITLGFEPASENSGVLAMRAPRLIPAGSRGTVEVRYDLSKTTLYGRLTDRVYALIDGRRATLPFSVTAIAVDNTAGVDEAAAPSVDLTEMFYHFGEVDKNGALSHEVKLGNKGRTPLVVRWVGGQPFMSCSLAAGTIVEPGRSVTFTVSMDARGGDPGTFTGTVTIITNDPIRPMREVRLAATID